MRHIKDAIHGYIKLEDEEEKIVDSPALQRLRCIKQLDFASLVYPGTNHTRFEHTLGTTYLAGQFANSLNLSETRRKELRIAALLHDTGHGPFSHAGEMVAKKHGISHEDFSCHIAEKIEDLYSVDSERIVKIIRGDLEISQVVCSDIDADRMDYLMRDSHYSGLEHGQIDTETIIRLAEINSRRLVYDQKGIQALESLLTSRFHMYKTLYMHETVSIASKMIEKSLEHYLRSGNDLEKMMRLDDYSAHCKLLNSTGPSKKLYKRLRSRNLYKISLKMGVDRLSKEELKSLSSSQIRSEELEQKIAEKTGLKQHQIIVDLPNIPEMEDLDIKIKKSDGIVELNQISPIPEALISAEWRHSALKVYTAEENVAKVNKASKEVLREYI